jgi:hypothetical protein
LEIRETIIDRLIKRPEIGGMYDHYEARTAEDFIDAISPLSPLKKERHRPLYRGHQCAAWPLVPKARRKEWPFKFQQGRNRSVRDRLTGEIRALLLFITSANRRGLKVPELLGLRKGLSFLASQLMIPEKWFAVHNWPTSESLDALALAQHHGIATCLLDVTWNPYVAAYFAAQEPTGRRRYEKLCVWMIDDLFLPQRLRSLDGSFEVLSPPAADNPRLHAQDGCFLHSVRPPLNVGGRPNAKYRAPVGGWENELVSAEIRLTKLTLERNKAKELRACLYALGYDAGYMFPGYDGAAWASEEWGADGFGPHL